MGFINKLKFKLSGMKTYLLIGFAVIVIVVQFLSGVDFGVPALPVADSLGELVEQLYTFLLAGTFRAAMPIK